MANPFKKANTVQVDGEACGWLKLKSHSRGVDVYWLAGTAPILVGRLFPSKTTSGWTAHPRLGGYRRAGESRRGWAKTRYFGIRHLVWLAREETALSMSLKVRWRIVREHGEGLIDDTQSVEPLPPARDPEIGIGWEVHAR